MFFWRWSTFLLAKLPTASETVDFLFCIFGFPKEVVSNWGFRFALQFCKVFCNVTTLWPTDKLNVWTRSESPATLTVTVTDPSAWVKYLAQHKCLDWLMICVKFISAVHAHSRFKLMKGRAETALLCFENLRCHAADTAFDLINYFKGGLTVYYSVFGSWCSSWCGSVRPLWNDVEKLTQQTNESGAVKSSILMKI